MWSGLDRVAAHLVGRAKLSGSRSHSYQDVLAPVPFPGWPGRRIRGTVQRFRSGEIHYVNFAPRFEVYYRPQKVPEELVYKRHDDLYTASGWNLQKVLDDFRTSKGVVEWGESPGPYDPNSKEPHILSLRHEWVF